MEARLMKAFCQLFEALDQTPRTSEKVAALENYFREVPPADAAWALYFLSGSRLKRLVKSSLLRECAAETAGLPIWMVDECLETAGDLAEAVALILPPANRELRIGLAEFVHTRLLPLSNATDAQQRKALRDTWAVLAPTQRFLWHKLITGNFRVGVSRALLIRGLANIAGVEPAVMAHRLTGEWQPTAENYSQLLAGDNDAPSPAKPYPFYLASPLEQPPAELGEVHDWFLEWKWDGIRAQLIRREDQAILWSRGEELISESFPEIVHASAVLPRGTVLDGEILAWNRGEPLPFQALQRRLHRRNVTPSVLREVPVVFMAYDILESGAEDWRSRPHEDRRKELERLIGDAQGVLETRPAGPESSRWVQDELFPMPEAVDGSLHEASTGTAEKSIPLRLSPQVAVEAWEAIASIKDQARAKGAEGIMFKHRESTYGVGRQRGAWWKWKLDPFTCDAVLVAAQPGHGRRATLFTDYTFALWSGSELVPVAKAYSGLSDEEIREVDAFVRRSTMGRFGPVRTVKPELVFELGFEAVTASSRHKSGVAVRFPRILRWRHDKTPADADQLEQLRQFMRRDAAP
jgi:DNA ligase-1